MSSACLADAPIKNNKQATSKPVQTNPDLILSFGTSATDNSPVRRTLTLAKLIEEFQVPDTKRGTLTSKEYHALKDTDPEEKAIKRREKDGQYFTLCAFGKNGRRANNNVEKLCGFTLDFDSGKTTRKEIEKRLNPYTYIAYTSYSHRPDHEKWRVVIPYSNPIESAQHSAVFEHFQNLFGGDVDPHCATASQLYYTPACPRDSGPEYQCFENIGNLFDPVAVKAQPPKEKSTTPNSPSATTDETKRLESALSHLSADDRKTWVEVGLAMKRDLHEGGLSIWLKWSGQSKKFELEDALKTWESLAPADDDSGITLAAIFFRAKKSGWIDLAPTEDVPEHIAEINKSHFFSFDGGRSLIFRETVDPLFHRHILDAMKPSDFKLVYANKFVAVAAGDNKTKRICIADDWIRHPNRREYSGLVLAPNKDVPGYYNLWRGFAVQAKRGSWKKMQQHIKNIICRNDKEAFTYLMNWLAHAIQRPDRPAEVAVVLRGGRGTGKGMFVRSFGELFGQHFVHISQGKHLTGNFNAHLRDCIVLFVDEAFWAGDKQGEAELKRLITEPTLAIERKGLDVTMTPNMLHVIMASNSQWVVPAGVDERRFFVLDIDDSMQQNAAYFSALDAELKAGGLEAMLYDLRKRDLSGFDVRQVPNTDALKNQKILSLEPHMQWWFEKLINGTLSDHEKEWGEIRKSVLHEDYLSHVKNTGGSRRATQTELGMKLSGLLPPGYPQSAKISVEFGTDKSVRKSVYRFPPLQECRKHFEEIARFGAVDWERGEYTKKTKK